MNPNAFKEFLQAFPWECETSIKALAAAAWDAALCAAQKASEDEAGKLKPAQEIAASLSALHTWNLPTTKP